MLKLATFVLQMAAVSTLLMSSQDKSVAEPLSRRSDANGLAVTGPAQPGVPARTVVPDSSIQKPGDIGKRAHTNIGIVVPGRRIEGPPTAEPGVRKP